MDSNHRSCRNRFTVCPLWPLGNPPIFNWSWWPDSNRQPADYKSAALPLSHTSRRAVMKSASLLYQIFFLLSTLIFSARNPGNHPRICMSGQCFFNSSRNASSFSGDRTILPFSGLIPALISRRSVSSAMMKFQPRVLSTVWISP